jgi:hypothetical protein
MTSVELVEWTAAQSAVVTRAKSHGVVVDLGLARATVLAQPMEAHRQAAFLGVSEFSRARACSLPPEPPTHGNRIGLERFYGSAFDHRTGRVTLQPPQTPEQWGYASAFMEPPYFQLTRREAETLFLEVNTLILESPSENREVWEWSTDWAPYFDAGNDWVGAAAWTVGAMDNRILVVGYSPVE